jgi:hypothetical protein
VLDFRVSGPLNEVTEKATLPHTFEGTGDGMPSLNNNTSIVDYDRFGAILVKLIDREVGKDSSLFTSFDLELC